MGRKGETLPLARKAVRVTFHTEILNQAMRDLLPSLGAFAGANGFYLGGGTAVALYYGHRTSIDFDWFTQGPMGDPLVLAEHARESGLELANPQIAAGTLHAVIDSVRVSFFEYPYLPVGEPTDWPDCRAALASLDDLACMKLAAIAQRGSRKDFIDLYVLALRHRPIADFLELYKRKYGTGDIAHVLLGLTYFDDADAEPSPVMMQDLPWDGIKTQFQQWTRELVSRPKTH
jgi:hypothetical protein